MASTRGVNEACSTSLTHCSYTSFSYLVEPDLQEVTSESLLGRTANSNNGARIDTAMKSFWGGRFERTFVDVGVFNTHAATRSMDIAKCYSYLFLLLKSAL